MHLVGFHYEEFNSRLDFVGYKTYINPLNAELNPIYHLLALLEARHILHVSRIRVKMVDISTVPCKLRKN